jgi:hypothetical protein
VERIFEEFAADAGLNYAGSIVRPYAFLMWRDGKLTEQGSQIVDLIQQAADEPLEAGKINPETQALISQPLITQENFINLWHENRNMKASLL